MRKIYKITNIALIFMVIGVLVCQDIGYASNLRVPIGNYTRIVGLSGNEADNKTKIGSAGNGNIIIDPLLPTHGDIYFLARDRAGELGKKILIFNVDAHPDRYSLRILDDTAPLQDSSTYDSSWAGFLAQDEKAVVLHMPSYWQDDRSIRMADSNWRTRKYHEILNYAKWQLREHEYSEWLLEEYEKYKDEIGEIWVTIDYDFFSLFTEVPDVSGYTVEAERLPIYHLTPEEIDEEIASLIKFFEDNNIIINRVVPSIPSNKEEYLNVPTEEKEAFIMALTEKINHAFGELSKRQEQKLKGSITARDVGFTMPGDLVRRDL